MFISETWVNATKGHQIGDSGLYEPFTEDTGELYRALVKEYGRCTGKVYIDTEDGARAIGWVFIKKMKYSDTGDPYLQETWITLHEDRPTITKTDHYKFIN